MNISGKTRVFGIIGCPVSHSASPLMHNTSFFELSMPSVYVPFNVRPENLADAVRGLKALDVAGFNVTIPHKETVLSFLDEVDPFAKKVGSVNTVVNQGGKFVGYNTDGDGFVTSLKEDLNLNFFGKSCVVLGSGGAARGILGALGQESLAELTVVSRNKKKAEALRFLLSNISFSAIQYDSEDLGHCLSKADIVINTTPLGMGELSEKSPVDNFSWVSPNQIVVDIIYNPRHTYFLKEAQSQGATIVNGLGMLAMQGVLAFKHFTQSDCSYHSLKKVIENSDLMV